MVEVSEYRDSYGDLNVHRTMLTDVPRMRAYYDAIVGAKDFFKDAVVLDVGTGTGILSIWVAKHTQAEKVIAVEANEKMAQIARNLVEANKVQDRVTVLHGLVEEIELPVVEVDIIISEWMGHYLLHESMLDSVIFARNKWLRRGAYPTCLDDWRERKSGGLLFPNKATIYGEIGYLTSMDLIEWANQDILFGCDISSVFPQKAVPEKEPLVAHIWKRADWSIQWVVKHLDLMAVESHELNEIDCTSVVQFKSEGIANCVILSFTCEFPISGVCLDTRSGRLSSHWKQTIIPLGGNFPIVENMTLSYRITIARDSNSDRGYDIGFEVLDD